MTLIRLILMRVNRAKTMLKYSQKLDLAWVLFMF